MESGIFMVGYVFKRYELKYLLSGRQYAAIAPVISEHLRPDEYGETTIQSLYYDSDDFCLVRASIEKPIYKEKLRLRCYGLNDTGKDVYLEMKRKYDGVVYKRRIASKEQEIQDIFAGNAPDSQIGREIGYFLSFYPTVAVILNIEADHLDFFKDLDDVKSSFSRFASRVPEDGYVVANFTLDGSFIINILAENVFPEICTNSTSCEFVELLVSTSIKLVLTSAVISDIELLATIS